MGDYQSEDQELSENEIKLINNLYDEMYEKLLNLAKRRVRNADVAKEIVQETFRIACMNIKKLTGSENRQGWLMQTLKNVTNNVERGQARLSSLFLQVSDIEEFANEATYNIEDNLPELLYSDITETEAYRLIKKVVFEHYTTAELAEEYGITAENARQRVHRARVKLQDMIKK